jgi:hypothetical protein
MDVSNVLKLDANRQKEKVSFFEELKKQSFLMSESSTNKVEGKNMNMTNQNKDKSSMGQDRNKGVSSSEIR